MSAACSIRMPRPFYWPLATASAPGLTPGQGGALVRTLRTEGLIEGAGRGIWTITQAGQTFSSATAAKPVTRAAAERALRSEEHTSELQSLRHLVCRLLLEK